MKQMMTMTRDVVLLASGMLALSAGAFSFTPSRFVGVYRDGENASFVSSYVAVAAHISILRDMEPKGDTGGAHDRLRLYRFQRKDGRLAYAAWAVEGTATTSIPIDLGTNYKMFDLFGNSVCRPRDGTLVLTESPVYLVSEP